ncbi:MAG TPA: MurR/RpiR family transcriptional regulator [Xanthobacteraceae bacterium]|nr:MurR/RpiR family transcriptional regulator [Xanthobacteraceae bacterium]
MGSDTSALQKLEAAYPKLSPRVRKAARYVQKHPTEIALYALRQVASDAGVSPTTMVRLAADLGFTTYNEFRNAFRDKIVRTGAEQYATNASRALANEPDGSDAVFEQARLRAAASIESLFSTVSSADVVRAANTLHGASKVYVIGMRSMYSATFYFDYVLRTFNRKSILVEDRVGMLIEEIGEISSSDVLLVISFEPYVVTAVKAVEYAAGAGASVIAITDSRLSPVAVRANQALIVPTSSVHFYQSLAPTMTLLEMILACMLKKAGKRAVDRIAAEFKRRTDFGSYWVE